MFSHFFFVFKQKTAYEMRISDWSSDVCSSDLRKRPLHERLGCGDRRPRLARQARRHFKRSRTQRGGFDDTVGDAPGMRVRRGDRLAERECGESACRSEGRREGKEGVRTCRSPWTAAT